MASKKRRSRLSGESIDEALESGKTRRGKRLSSTDRKVLEALRSARDADADDVREFGERTFGGIMYRVTAPFAGRDVTGRRLEDDDVPTYIRMGVCGCLVAWSVFLAAGTVAAMSNHGAVMDSLQDQTRQAAVDYADAQRYVSPSKEGSDNTESGRTGSSADSMKATVESVTTFANDVAALQNSYNNPDTDNEKLKRIAAKLRTYFTEEALKTGTLDPATPWYSGYQTNERGVITGEPMDPHTYGWVFPGSVDVASDQGDVSIVWLNRNRATGELYAWVKADFDPRAKKFHHLALGMTSAGRTHNGTISAELPIINGTGGSQNIYHPGIGQRPSILDEEDPTLPTTVEGWNKRLADPKNDPGRDPAVDVNPQTGVVPELVPEGLARQRMRQQQKREAQAPQGANELTPPIAEQPVGTTGG